MESEISGKTLDDSPSEAQGEGSYLLSGIDQPSSPHRLDSISLARPTISSSFYSSSSCEGAEPPMIGAGLVNLGNTCYLNAVLQCFTHTVPLVQSLRSCNHAAPCRRGIEGFCALCALRDQIELSLASSGGTVAPYKLVDNLSYLSPSFRQYEQEDAHEFLQCLLDRLDSSCSDMGHKDQNMPLQDDNFVNKVFGGCLQSQLRCCNCGHCWSNFEPLIDLSLEIEDVNTLPEALKSFTKNEKIEETKFRCEECKENVFVEKKITLAETPLVAAFHLKRFKNDGSYVEKIDKLVEYPLTLDLQPYTSDKEYNNVQLRYELYAVVVHIEFSSNSGHYFSFIRSAPQTWYRFDDSKVVRVSEESVLSHEAYILFYTRQGTPSFASLMEAQKQCVELNRVSTSPKSVLDNIEIIHTALPVEASVSASVVEATDDAEEIPIAIHLDNCGDKAINTSNAVPLPTTPTRSPSPDIYSEEPPEVSYSIPRDHLREKDNLKGPVDKALEDSKRKEAFRLTKSMPHSRAMKLRACMLGSHSESSSTRKKQKMGFSGDGMNTRRLSYGYL